MKRLTYFFAIMGSIGMVQAQLINKADTITILNRQETMIYSQSSLDELNRRIFRVLEKSPCKLETNRLYIHHIFYYTLRRNLEKDDLLDSYFPKNLIILPNYTSIWEDRKKKEYICTRAVVFDENNTLLGFATPAYFYCSSVYSSEYIKGIGWFAATQKKKYNIRYLFAFDGVVGSVLFGIARNGALCVFHTNNKNPKTFIVSSAEEFVSDYWEDYFD